MPLAQPASASCPRSYEYRRDSTCGNHRVVSFSRNAGGDMLRLSELSDERLREEFEHGRSDLSTLEAINNELKARDSDDAFDLQLEVVGALTALRKTAKLSSAPRDALARWTSSYLFRRSLQSPDGRPLHCYRMSDTEYGEVRELLRGSTSRLLREDGIAASLFVVFCAEWFRREATSLFLRWDQLNSDALDTVPHSTRRRLAEIGLKFWRRDLVRSDGAREFLLTLALEGGISAHVISEGGSSWLSDYLRTLMRFALADAAAEHVRGYAHDMSWMVRVSYRQEGFIDLCCELIMKLVEWRRIADAAPSGIDPISYLDAQNPEWRSSLPIHVPPDNEKIARRLLGGLLSEKAGSIVASGITVERYLSFDGERWLPAAVLNAEGEISAAKVPGLSTSGRWKASPSGDLANFLPSQIALFEPPTDDQPTWRVRSVTPLGKLLVGLDLDRNITVNLTCGSDAVPFAWPGGAGLTSPIMSFVPDDATENSEPRKLRLVRTGSASLPSAKVYVLVPADWSAVPGEGSPTGRQWPASGRRTVHEVLGTTYFMKPGAGSDERYRVEAGKDERQESLDISGAGPSSIQTTGDLEILEGPVTFGIFGGGTSRRPKSGELRVRKPGENWMTLADRKLAAPGVYEISWRDPIADIQLERRRIAIVPAGARILGEMQSATAGRVALDLLSGWDIDISDNGVEAERRGDERFFTFAGRPRFRLHASLRPPVGRPFDVVVPLKARQASILLSDGSVVGPGQEMDITALRGAVAASPHTTALTLSARNTRSSSLQFRFSGEFPLAALKPIVEELMAPVADQDAMLELEFLGDSRTPTKLKQYRYPRPAFVDGAIVFGAEFTETPVVRMILKPEREHLLQRTSDGSYSIPEWCEGPCLVYLRDGPDVVARPLLVILPLRGPISSPLLSALAETHVPSRMARMATVLGSFEDGTLPVDDVRYLHSLACGLNGLPATAFDILKEIGRRPRALLRLLTSARSDVERQAVWALQEKLPFIWLALPTKDWQAVLSAEFEELLNALASFPGTTRNELIVGHFRNLREKFVSLEPALDLRFDQLGVASVTLPALHGALEGYIKDQRMYDDDSPYRPSQRNLVLEHLTEAAIKLPPEFDRFSVNDFEGMAVPAALAAVAAGRLTLTSQCELVIRKTLREHGRYVSSAYPHLLRFYEVRT
ncbi:STY4851/ECs_5259 family protein [Sinorhizobium meliloti]|uniref:STY4851/ECs_5259 family protein n=1 Tax=Rhizobium meliloti TaxID=382 RepID=UPI003F5CDBAB